MWHQKKKKKPFLSWRLFSKLGTPQIIYQNTTANKTTHTIFLWVSDYFNENLHTSLWISMWIFVEIILTKKKHINYTDELEHIHHPSTKLELKGNIIKYKKTYTRAEHIG